MTHDKLTLIAKLLAQAENAGTQEEAGIFMGKAQQLATIHGVDLARARYVTISKERTLPIQRAVTIGLPADRGLTTLVDLFLGIAAANDLKCTIAQNNTKVYAHGFAEDIDVSEALYASLLVQLAKFSAEHKAEGSWRDQMVEVGSGWFSERRPITWLTARLNFQDGFAGRIRRRLSEAKYEELDRQRKLEKERASRPHLDDEGHVVPEFASWMEMNQGIDLDDLEDQTGTVAELSEVLRNVEDEMTQELLTAWKAHLIAQKAQRPGTELVLAAKSEAIDKLYDEKNPHLRRGRSRSYQGGLKGATARGSRSAGQAAGDRARLGGSTSISNKKAIGR